MGIAALLTRSVELHCKMHWLKKINKELDKAKKLREKLIVQNRVTRDLIDQYNELYKDDPIVLKGE